jgi:branched-chain amino acid aminotransferase
MSEEYLCFQGEFYRQDQSPLHLNRAFLYGDGVFESMRSKGDRIHLFPMHIQRLQKSLEVLKIEYNTELFNEIELAAKDLIRKNRLSQGARLRLTVFRSGGGRFLPQSNRPSYLIQAESCSPQFELNAKGLNLELADSVRIYPNPFSTIKTIASQAYILAAMECEQRGFDELLLLNQRGEVVEGTHSNLFIRIGKEVITPHLQSGCLAGVMRAHIIQLIEGSNHHIIQREVGAEELMSADEVFMTNSISGLRWVGSYRQKRYFSDLSKKLIDLLNQEL